MRSPVEQYEPNASALVVEECHLCLCSLGRSELPNLYDRENC